jgi:hypothetical protein
MTTKRTRPRCRTTATSPQEAESLGDRQAGPPTRGRRSLPSRATLSVKDGRKASTSVFRKDGAAV